VLRPAIHLAVFPAAGQSRPSTSSWRARPPAAAITSPLASNIPHTIAACSVPSSRMSSLSSVSRLLRVTR